MKTNTKQSVNVNARDVYRETPLHYASSHGHVDIVNLLLKKGADINARAKNGSTAVIYAATNGKRCKRIIKSEGGCYTTKYIQ